MFIKLIRLGRDSELRQTQQGKSVLNFAGAYDVGYGDNKHTQWIDCALWGDRGAKVAHMLTKGTQIVIYASDVELEKFPKADGSQGAKIKCRIIEFEFAGSRPDSQAPQAHPQYQQPAPQAPRQMQPAPQAQPQYQQPAPQAQPAPANSFDDFDDNIPF